MATKKQTKTQNNSPNEFNILMNWVRDGNLKSKFPKELEKSKILSVPFFLVYFLSSPNYFILINKLLNNYEAFKISPKDLYTMFKEIVYFTRFSSFNKKKATVKENPLIKKLKEKFPYYKKEEIIMAVNIIDNSDDKACIYEMFGINDTPKAKKMTKKDIKDRQNKIKNIISSDDLLNVI